MTLDQLIAAKRAEIAALETAPPTSPSSPDPWQGRATEADEARVEELRGANATIDTERPASRSRSPSTRPSGPPTQAADAGREVNTPGAPSPSERRAPAVVTSEERTYAPHKERGFDQAHRQDPGGLQARRGLRA
jgi:hypothetical protein